MDKYDQSLTLEKYSQVTNGRILKYNGDTSGPGMDKYRDKYRERFQQDRCRYANELVSQT